MLADYIRVGQFPLADYVRGDKICGGTESAPLNTGVDYNALKNSDHSFLNSV